MISPPPAIELLGVTKCYPRVAALSDISLRFLPGEVHALVGENGAGKSTLVRILAGLESPDHGGIRIAGDVLPRLTPALARARGLGFVHQHFTLVEAFSVAENLALGCEPRWPVNKDLGWLGIVTGLSLLGAIFDRRAAASSVRNGARRSGLTADPERAARSLGVGERQRAEIEKAMLLSDRGSRVLVLDEPTAVLAPAEAHELLSRLRRIADAGAAVVLVTHKLAEVFAIADRVTVLRRGRVGASTPVGETTPDEVASLMFGVAGLPELHCTTGRPGAVTLRVRGLAVRGRGGAPALEGVDLEVRAGEIVGVAGVDGNGQAELVAALTGIARPQAGSVTIAGRDVTRATTAERLESGALAHIAADRHRHAVLLDASLEENLLLGLTHRRDLVGRFGIHRPSLRRFAVERLRALDVRPEDPRAIMATLSGGNQQKAVLARELARRAALLIAAEPTRGLDLTAAARVRDEILRARDGGAAVLLVSSDTGEVLALSDRVAVLYRGRLAGVLSREEASEAALGRLMTGSRA